MMRCWHPEKSRVNKNPHDGEQALARQQAGIQISRVPGTTAISKPSSAAVRVTGVGGDEGSASSLNQTIKPSAAGRVVSNVKTRAINGVAWIYVPNKGLQKV